MRIFNSNGICIESGEYKFMLDPSRAVKRSDVLVGISHAHSDHIALHTSPTLFTPETSGFFSCPSTKQHKLRYGDHMDVGERLLLPRLWLRRLPPPDPALRGAGPSLLAHPL